jgi:hypothetical protein
MCDVWRITPPHENPEPARVEALAADMRSRGFAGRPILVEPLDDSGDAFQAWTGGHRLAAALKALDTVPIHVIDMARFAPFFAGELEQGETLFSRTISDEQRLEALTEVGDLQSAQLMRAELRSRSR